MFFNISLTETGCPHFGFESSQAIYLESPVGLEFDMESFPFPICYDNMISISNNDNETITRISLAVIARPFVRAFVAVKRHFGLVSSRFDEYLDFIYPLLFNRKCLRPDRTQRDLWQVKRYLSKFMKSYLTAFADAREQDLVVMFVLLTCSACFTYQKLEPKDETTSYGFSFMLFTNLFSPSLNRNALFLTTRPAEDFSAVELQFDHVCGLNVWFGCLERKVEPKELAFDRPSELQDRGACPQSAKRVSV
jgi:hypothetical protein